MKKVILNLGIVSLLYACSSDKTNGTKEDNNSEATAVELNKEDVAEDPQDDYSEGVFNEDETTFPSDFEIESYLITPAAGGYHESDELKKLKAKSKWIGLYKNDKGELTLKASQVQFKKVYDPFSDNEKGPFTGIEPIVSPGENCEMAFNPIYGISPKNLDLFVPYNKEMGPDESIEFTHNGTKFWLSTSGTKVNENGQEGIRDFKLYLDWTNHAGRKMSQLLLQLPTYDEYEIQRITVQVCGLIDDDQIPDLIVRNNYQSYLYLSNTTVSNGLLKCVGTEVLFGGC